MDLLLDFLLFLGVDLLEVLWDLVEGEYVGRDRFDILGLELVFVEVEAIDSTGLF
jgi:hypothetical protein